MSTTYRAIDWNRQKRLYDLALGGLLLLGFATFIVVSWLRSPTPRWKPLPFSVALR